MENSQENPNPEPEDETETTASTSQLQPFNPAPSLDMTPEVYAEKVRVQLLQYSDVAIEALVSGLTSSKVEIRRQTAKDYFTITGIQAQKASMADASINAVKEIAATTIKSTLETLGQMFGNDAPIVVNTVEEKKIAPKKSTPKKVSDQISDNDILELLDGQ